MVWSQSIECEVCSFILHLCFINSGENKSLLSTQTSITKYKFRRSGKLSHWILLLLWKGFEITLNEKKRGSHRKKIYCIWKETRLQSLPPCVALPSPPGLYQHYPAIKISEDQSTLNALILREPLLSISLPHPLPLTISLSLSLSPPVPQISPLLLHALHFDASTQLVPPDCGWGE